MKYTDEKVLDVAMNQTKLAPDILHGFKYPGYTDRWFFHHDGVGFIHTDKELVKQKLYDALKGTVETR